MKAPHAALERVYRQIEHCERLVAECEASGRPRAAKVYRAQVTSLKERADRLNAKLTVAEANSIVNEADR